ncbi:MAG: hypothetical protein AB7S77_10520 [Desulfatirhabdiaceae bacterium]
MSDIAHNRLTMPRQVMDIALIGGYRNKASINSQWSNRHPTCQWSGCAKRRAPLISALQLIANTATFGLARAGFTFDTHVAGPMFCNMFPEFYETFIVDGKLWKSSMVE